MEGVIVTIRRTQSVQGLAVSCDGLAEAEIIAILETVKYQLVKSISKDAVVARFEKEEGK